MRISRPIENEKLFIDWRMVGPLGTNSFLVFCKETKEGVLIDPAAEPDVLSAWLERHGVKLKALLLTHAHFDHLGAVKALKEKFGVEIYLAKGDWPIYKDAKNYAALFSLSIDEPPFPPDKELHEGESFKVGQLELQIWETPGHSPGSVCFYIEDGYLFSGDTLFAGSIGRTDLPGGSYATLMKSLRRLTKLPDKTLVFPGHGEMSSIRLEKRQNPFLR